MIDGQIISCLGGIAFGYFLGRIDSLIDRFKKTESSSFVSEVNRDKKATRRQVEIDDAKFVTDISTEDFQKFGTNDIGIVTKTADNISSARSKLAELKKKKDR